jgi:hypothetical protein
LDRKALVCVRSTAEITRAVEIVRAAEVMRTAEIARVNVIKVFIFVAI